MAMRNFWVTINADGVKNPVATGSKARAGIVQTNIAQLNMGQSDIAYTVTQQEVNNTLITTILHKGSKVHEYITVR